jgi:D-psicose/D-tagatose/L-ribulose 3-epimerase
MKLGISNIAWPPDMEPQAADLLQSLAVAGVEIAPTTVWRAPIEVGHEEIARYRRFWNDRGIQIIALQALLFGRPDLTLFGSAAARAEMLAYLSGMVRLCAQLGGEALVFGSPRNRNRGDLSDDDATRIAADFFHEVGERASAAGVTFCIEANPPAYDCNFITTSAQAVDLVRRVGNPGFGVHLDAGGMTLAEERPEEAVTAAHAWCRHFHVSEPQLRPIGTAGADHRRFGAALRRLEYQHWISIEMRAQGPESCVEDITSAIARARQDYGLA